MLTLEGASFSELARKAVEACNHGPVLNLVLHASVSRDELDSPFLDGFKSKALKWQDPVRPTDLVFNHGEYMMGALDYVVDELRRKPDSNRACAVLLRTSDLIGRGDEPVPSFLVVQFAVDQAAGLLSTTCYYRALEVVEFLPVNLAEAALMSKSVLSGYPGVADVDLTLFAFRAHRTPGFNLFERASLDLAAHYDVYSAVVSGNTDQLATWISSKLVVESQIETEGLQQLLVAVERQPAGVYSAEVVENLAEAIDAMEQLREFRCTKSTGAEVALLTERVQTSLKAARDGLV